MHQPTDDDEEVYEGAESVEELEHEHGSDHKKQYVCFCGHFKFEILLCTTCTDVHIVGLECENCGAIHQSMLGYTYDELEQVRH